MSKETLIPSWLDVSQLQKVLNKRVTAKVEAPTEGKVFVKEQITKQAAMPNYVPLTLLDKAFVNRGAEALAKHCRRAGMAVTHVRCQNMVRLNKEAGSSLPSPYMSQVDYIIDYTDANMQRVTATAAVGFDLKGSIHLPASFYSRGKEVAFDRKAVQAFSEGRVYAPADITPQIPNFHYYRPGPERELIHVGKFGPGSLRGRLEKKAYPVPMCKWCGEVITQIPNGTGWTGPNGQLDCASAPGAEGSLHEPRNVDETVSNLAQQAALIDEQDEANTVLISVAEQAQEGDERSQDLLERVFEESWESILKKLEVEGSTHYMWWMEGVQNFLEMHKQKTAARSDNAVPTIDPKEQADDVTNPKGDSVSLQTKSDPDYGNVEKGRERAGEPNYFNSPDNKLQQKEVKNPKRKASLTGAYNFEKIVLRPGALKDFELVGHSGNSGITILKFDNYNEASRAAHSIADIAGIQVEDTAQFKASSKVTVALDDIFASSGKESAFREKPFDQVRVGDKAENNFGEHCIVVAKAVGKEGYERRLKRYDSSGAMAELFRDPYFEGIFNPLTIEMVAVNIGEETYVYTYGDGGVSVLQRSSYASKKTAMVDPFDEIGVPPALDFRYEDGELIFTNDTAEYKGLNLLDEDTWQAYTDILAAAGVIIEYDNVADSFYVWGPQAEHTVGNMQDMQDAEEDAYPVSTASKKTATIHIQRVRESQSGGKWVDGLFEGYLFQGLLFDEPSQYGINGGRVSKLTVGPAASGRAALGLDRAYDYDRGLNFDNTPEGFINSRLVPELEAAVPPQEGVVEASKKTAARYDENTIMVTTLDWGRINKDVTAYVQREGMAKGDGGKETFDPEISFEARHPWGLIEAPVGLLVTDECVGLTKEPYSIGFYSIKGKSFGVMSTFNANFSAADLKEYANGTMTLKEFMGSRYNYNSRIISNLGEILRYVNGNDMTASKKVSSIIDYAFGPKTAGLESHVDVVIDNEDPRLRSKYMWYNGMIVPGGKDDALRLMAILDKSGDFGTITWNPYTTKIEFGTYNKATGSITNRRKLAQLFASNSYGFEVGQKMWYSGGGTSIPVTIDKIYDNDSFNVSDEDLRSYIVYGWDLWETQTEADAEIQRIEDDERNLHYSAKKTADVTPEQEGHSPVHTKEVYCVGCDAPISANEAENFYGLCAECWEDEQKRKKNASVKLQKKAVEGYEEGYEPTQEDMIQDVVSNFKAITGHDIEEALTVPGAADENAPLFNDAIIELTFPSIEEYVKEKYGEDIASDTYFLEALDGAIADETIR